MGISAMSTWRSPRNLCYKGQNPLHRFPRSKSVTSWSVPRSVANKPVTSLQHKRQVRIKCVISWQQVGNFPVYDKVKEKRV